MYRNAGAIYCLQQLGLCKSAEEGQANYLPTALGVGAAALGGLGGYKYLRRQNLSSNPLLRNLQQQVGDKPFEVATHQPTGSRMGRAFRRVLYGAPDISDQVHAAGRAGQVLKRDATVLHHGSPFSRMPVEGAVNINDPSSGLTAAMADKGTFAKIFKQIQEQSPDLKAIPATESFGDVVNAFGGDMDKMRKHLTGALPEGWIIKPTDESLGSLESFVSNSTDAADPRWKQLSQNPGSFILQEKIPIKQEYRVHTAQGVPFTATHRRLPEGKMRDMWNSVSKRLGIGEGGFAHLPATGDKRKALMDYVESVNKPLGEHYKDAPMHQAFDVAELPDGSFRLIESNPTPGTFNNPLISRGLQEAVTGRMHKDKAMLGALGIGAGVGAAGYGSGSLLNKGDD